MKYLQLYLGNAAIIPQNLVFKKQIKKREKGHCISLCQSSATKSHKVLYVSAISLFPGSRPSSGSPRITKEQVTRQQSGGSSRSASSVDVVDGRPHCQSQVSYFSFTIYSAVCCVRCIMNTAGTAFDTFPL